MTQPQPDPAQDVGAALARLAEQTIGLQRQLNRIEDVIRESQHVAADLQREVESRITLLTDAKFVTYRTLIDSQAEKVALALDAAEKAIAKAEASTEKRFDSVNEFRQQLNDQARTFMPRTEALQLSEQATQRIRELAEVVPTLVTRLEVQATTDRWSERISELNDRLNRSEGQGQGAKDNRAGLIAVISVAVAILVAAIALFNFISSQ